MTLFEVMKRQSAQLTLNEVKSKTDYHAGKGTDRRDRGLNEV